MIEVFSGMFLSSHGLLLGIFCEYIDQNSTYNKFLPIKLYRTNLLTEKHLFHVEMIPFVGYGCKVRHFPFEEENHTA